MLLALACTRTPGPGELQPPGLPKLATAVTGAAAQPGQLDVAGPFRPVWRTDDVCATAWQRPGLSELCEPWLPSPTCVGERCPRWDARNALECLIAAGTDVETFAALSRRDYAGTRLYAREGLLRVGGMITARIVEGLTDAGSIESFDRCTGRGWVWAGTPAYLALLQRADGEADTLIAAFLDSTLARAVLFDDGACARTELREATLSLLQDPRRSAAVRTRVAALRRHIVRSLPPGTSAEEREARLRATMPQALLQRWTRTMRCEPRGDETARLAADALDRLVAQGELRTRMLTLESQIAAGAAAESPR